jgi:hypothetical protein
MLDLYLLKIRFLRATTSVSSRINIKPSSISRNQYEKRLNDTCDEGLIIDYNSPSILYLLSFNERIDGCFLMNEWILHLLETSFTHLESIGMQDPFNLTQLNLSLTSINPFSFSLKIKL